MLPLPSLLLALVLPAVPARAQTPSSGPAPAALYELGMSRYRSGDPAAAKRAFLELQASDPRGTAALEGLGLSCLALREYEEARGWLARWNERTPGNAYILGLLARADKALDREDDLLADLRALREAGPADPAAARSLDEALRRTTGAFPEGRAYKSLGFEGFETGDPQRIQYEGRSGGVRFKKRLSGLLDLDAGYSVRQEAQRNDSRGFTYFDVLEQTPSVGATARPARGVDLQAEYGQSYLSDNKGLGVGKTRFSRARFAGAWRAGAATVRAEAGRTPYLLRGTGGDAFFALLRRAYGSAEVEAYRWGWGFLGRGSLEGFSDGTTNRGWSLAAFRELGEHRVRADLGHSQQDYFGAGPDGRVRFVGFDRAGAGYRFLREGVARVDGSYAASRYRDANRLQEASGGLALWLPRVRSVSAEYRVEAFDYRSPVDGYRSTDWTAHWLGPHWRPALAPGVWAHLAWEHGFERDARGPFDANAVLGELEVFAKDQASLKATARAGRSTARDDSFSLGLAARWSF